MHYRNGREAKNGDNIVQLSMDGDKVIDCGVLINAVPGNGFCNGQVANPLAKTFNMACLADCLHQEDVSGMLAEAGLHKRTIK